MTVAAGLWSREIRHHRVFLTPTQTPTMHILCHDKSSSTLIIALLSAVMKKLNFILWEVRVLFSPNMIFSRFAGSLSTDVFQQVIYVIILHQWLLLYAYTHIILHIIVNVIQYARDISGNTTTPYSSWQLIIIL